MKFLRSLALALCGLSAAAQVPAPERREQAPAASAAHDPRADYDVQGYRIDLKVDPQAEQIDGVVTVEALALVDDFRHVRLDLAADLSLFGASVTATEDPLGFYTGLSGDALVFSRTADFIDIQLPKPLSKGAAWRVALHYGGKPGSANDFDGFHWAKTPDGKPWITTSCQGSGSHSWWPCKDSFWHPEDKPEHVELNITVPEGLTAVCNGRSAGSFAGPHVGESTFGWRHDYPLETYSVALNIAPYVVVHQELALDGLEEFGGKLNFDYYVIPGHEERAKLQFQDVPKMLAAYTKAFGPFPFPKSKFALVETSFWGMEHSTAVAYGSSFPAWCKQTGAPDRYAERNKFYDYILIHESAHEWWGNAVSAADWGDFWIHEGFGTYAEGVYLEFTQSAQRAEEFFATQRRGVAAKSRLYAGKGTNSGEAYSGVIYSKGAAVLHTLRQYVADDAAWWRSLKNFNLAFRYKNATTDDFRAVLEKETGRDWKEFFDEWVYGSGYPSVEGKLRVEGTAILVEANSTGGAGLGFHVPLDLTWSENGAAQSQRVWLKPGANMLRIERKCAPQGIRTPLLERLLGRYSLELTP